MTDAPLTGNASARAECDSPVEGSGFEPSVPAQMVPGLPALEAVRAVCAAVGKPFNFMVGIKGKSFTVAALAAAGVKRISLATSLYRAAMTGLLSAAKRSGNTARSAISIPPSPPPT
jgi:hypothetical protein